LGRSVAALFVLGAALLLGAVPAAAQTWPVKPVRVVVPFVAGGSTDRMGRVVADELSKTFKQQFFVENRPGGGGALGAGQVARAEADGYTLVMGGYGPHVLGPSANPGIGYDPIADFTHIAMVGGESYVLAAHASLGVKSLADLLALAKSRAQPINVGSPGTGTLGQLMVEQLRLKASAGNLNHVPYRGGAPLTTDLLGNHVPVAAIPIASINEHIRAGTIIALVASSSERIPLLQEVPTFKEAGYPDIGGSIWFWLAGPKNLPSPIVAKLSQEVRRIVQTPEVQQQFERDALLSKDVDPAALNAFIEGELKRWTAFVEEAGLKQK
jgi:tripartite-type tricarboxylate transporter receptor subunit TctC